LECPPTYLFTPKTVKVSINVIVKSNYGYVVFLVVIQLQKHGCAVSHCIRGIQLQTWMRRIPLYQGDTAANMDAPYPFVSGGYSCKNMDELYPSVSGGYSCKKMDALYPSVSGGYGCKNMDALYPTVSEGKKLEKHGCAVSHCIWVIQLLQKHGCAVSHHCIRGNHLSPPPLCLRTTDI
jgi:hypothetical protein